MPRRTDFEKETRRVRDDTQRILRRGKVLFDEEFDSPTTTPSLLCYILSCQICFINSRSGLVVKFVLAMHEPRVRFTAATVILSFVVDV